MSKIKKIVRTTDVQQNQEFLTTKEVQKILGYKNPSSVSYLKDQGKIEKTNLGYKASKVRALKRRGYGNNGSKTNKFKKTKNEEKAIKGLKKFFTKKKNEINDVGMNRHVHSAKVRRSAKVRNPGMAVTQKNRGTSTNLTVSFNCIKVNITRGRDSANVILPLFK